jgi:hypothetical protein
MCTTARSPHFGITSPLCYSSKIILHVCDAPHPPTFIETPMRGQLSVLSKQVNIAYEAGRIQGRQLQRDNLPIPQR